MWSGAVVDIPDGWALCNGSNGTPNLAGRFIVGQDLLYPINTTGGNYEHTHICFDPGHVHQIPAGPDIAAGSDYSKATTQAYPIGSTSASENEPLWYALAFIMKLFDDPDPAFSAAFPYAAKAIVQFIMVGVDLEIYLTFKHKMNIDNKPALALWICKLNGGADAVDSSTWLDHWTLKLVILAPAAAPSNVTVEYDGPDDNLATTWAKQWEPWGAIQGTNLS